MPASNEAQITEWIASQKQSMIDLLRDVVNIDSGSYDKPGVDAVGSRFQQHFAAHGIEAWREPHDVFGDAIHALVAKPGSNEKPVLLMGHRDTVFPKGEVARRPFTIEGSRAYGPGVADMKGGLVINAFVAAAFHKFGSAPCPIKVLITADEEIGSPSSRPVIEREGRAARAVYNSEPGRPTGNVITGRKGGVFMRVEIAGKAAHSGNNFGDGISAIGELAHKIVQIHALTDMAKGITLNVGADRRRAVGKHHRAPCRGPDRHALHRSRRPRKDAGGDREDHRNVHRAGHDGKAAHPRRISAAGAERHVENHVRCLSRGGKGCRPAQP